MITSKNTKNHYFYLSINKRMARHKRYIKEQEEKGFYYQLIINFNVFF